VPHPLTRIVAGRRRNPWLTLWNADLDASSRAHMQRSEGMYWRVAGIATCAVLETATDLGTP
jgi:hypothetical protein